MKKKYFFVCFVFILIGITIYTNLINKKSNIKYVFLFIGDGMSHNQIELTEIYNNYIQNKNTYEQQLLSFTQFPSIGLRKNFSLSNYIPDSAASATAIASGLLTDNGMLNIDKKQNINKPITYELKEKGYKIGIITNVPLNHATPAAFYSINEDRNNYDQIAEDLIKSNFDYFAGSDIYLTENNKEILLKKMEQHGYNVIKNDEDLNYINKNEKNIIISPNANDSDFISLTLDEYTNFNLPTYVQKGIDALDNKNGFFMMIESGNIDGASHNNDAKSIISEINELDKAVQFAIEFASKHKNETLIIVTGDHETGGLTLGNENLKYYLNLQSLENQKLSLGNLYWYANEIINNNMNYETLIEKLNLYYGIINSEDIALIKNIYDEIKTGNTEILKQTVMNIINKNAGIHFVTTSHTGNNIPVYIFGPNSQILSGTYSSTEFNKRLRKILNI